MAAAAAAAVGGRGGPGGGGGGRGGPAAVRAAVRAAVAAARAAARAAAVAAVVAAAAVAVAAAATAVSEREGSDLVENVIAINRVAKVVKGGRRFSLQRARRRRRRSGEGRLRDRQGERSVGGGPQGRRAARRNMVTVPLTGGTIPHEIVGEHGAGRVLMKPAAPGAGVIAGGAVRAVMECAGITDILTKSLGSTNPHNMVRAAMDGLQQLTTVEQIARERGVEPSTHRLPVARQVEGGGVTCHGHSCGTATRGPQDDAEERADRPGKVRIKQVRSGIGHPWRRCAGRSRRSASGTTRTS